MDLVPSRPSSVPAIQREAHERLSLHDRSQQYRYVTLLFALVAVLATPTWFLGDLSYRGTLDLHAAMKVLGAFVGLATGLTLVLRYYRLDRHRFDLFVGVAFLVNGTADVANGLLCFRGIFPLEERDRGMGEFLRTVYLRSQLLMGAAMIAALLFPRVHQRKNWRDLLGWSVLAAAFPIPFILLWQDLGAAAGSGTMLGGAVFVVMIAAAVLCLDRYLFRREMFSWWLSAALFVNALGVLFVVLSREPLDALFDLAHVYKAIGYFLPLVGCLLHQVAREQAYFTAQEALIAAREQAMAGERAKSEFLANMSHELRTPMNGVLGLVGRAMRRNEAGGTSDLKAAYQSAQALLQLLDDVLDLSKIEANALTVIAAPFRPQDLLESAVQPLLPLLQQKGLSIERTVDESTPAVLVGDAARIRQILINLVGNAAKFTERGAISLRVRFEPSERDRGRLLVDVEDTGIGIPADKQVVVFEAFQQVDASTTRRYGGAGLGLAICVQLVRLMNGTISLKSEAGAGSTFSFDVEVRRANDAEAAASAPTSTPELTIPRANFPKVLAAAEDNPVNRRVLVGMLEEMGHAVLTAENGRELLSLLDGAEGSAVDAVLLDLQMPEIDGLEVVHRIRVEEQKTGGRRMPIVAVTAHAMKGDRERCLAAGVDDYLVKPVEHGRLFEIIESLAPTRGSVDRSGFWRQIAGRRELGRELLAMFEVDSSSLWIEANIRLADRDSIALAETAHRLAGSLANFHAPIARDAARRLERAARASDWDAAERTLPILQLLTERAVAELHECLAVEIDAA